MTDIRVHVDMRGRGNWSPQLEDDIMELGWNVAVGLDSENNACENELFYMTEHEDHIGPDPLIGECEICKMRVSPSSV